MNEGTSQGIPENASRKVDVLLVDGTKLTCHSRADAELILDAQRRHFEGSTGRKLPRETLTALERTGLNAANSMLYRSAMLHVEQE